MTIRKSTRLAAFGLAAALLASSFPGGTKPVKAEDNVLGPVPSLLITELAPDSPNKTNDAGKVVDGYEFIEVYNNSDVPVPLKGYKILYYSSSTYATWTLNADKSVMPLSSMILWVQSPNLTVTADQFNAAYGSSIREDQFYPVVTAGFSNTGSRRVLLTTPDGIEISRAEYVGINDAADSTSIVYSYPLNGSTLMRQTAIKQPPTPGVLLPGQAPSAAAPAAPAGLKAAAGDRQVTLSWSVGADPAHDRYQLLVNGKPADDLITGTSYTLKGLYNYTSYSIALRAVNQENQISLPVSVKSTPVPAVKDSVAPAAPAGVTAEAGAGEVKLSWQPNAEGDVMAYRIYTDGKLSQTVDSSTYSATVPNLTGGTAYRFETAALDSSNNESAKSASETAVPEHQPITQEDMGFEAPDPFEPFTEYLDTSEPGAFVPGLRQNLIPQGIDYVKEKNWTVISAYRSDKRPSMLSFLDDATGKLVKSFHLYNPDGTPYNGHAGGVTVSGKHTWVANNRFLYQNSLEDVYRQQDNTNLTFTPGGFRVYNNASFATYADGTLWTGDYYYPPSYQTPANQKLINRDGVEYGAWMTGYKLDPETDNLPAGRKLDDATPVTPDYILSIPNKIQGAAFAGDHILLSYTAENAYSSLLKYRNPMKDAPHTYVEIDGKQVPVWFLDSAEKEDEMMIPPYAEEISVRGNKACLVFESGASTFSPYMYYPIDQVHCLDLAAWEAYDGISIQGLDETMVHGSAASLKVLHALGEKGTFDVTKPSVLTTSNPAVALVSPEGILLATGPGEAVITAEYEGRKAERTVKVIPRLDSLTLQVPEHPVDRGAVIPIKVTAFYSDGLDKDVTASARYLLSRTETAELQNGVWTARTPGRTLITASYEGKETEPSALVVRAKTEK
ncbi:fibronectin type III domain-containing protein [Paenibacillus aurantius]|uniref:Fibronectin type III domain-containing protein n=1 Tax=Paenibacillus aurantius TaxID=2918900 RepID=A0AA96RBG7_9BACL|nr:lamin tail domain-containing protein [Paenibacillus aurantius]WNQ09460.1 fibronectin type III domain-containing protein [Paenibacillus aurantius]